MLFSRGRSTTVCMNILVKSLTSKWTLQRHTCQTTPLIRVCFPYYKIFYIGDVTLTIYFLSVDWDPTSAEEAEMGYGQLYGGPDPLDLFSLRSGIAFGAGKLFIDISSLIICQ